MLKWMLDGLDFVRQIEFFNLVILVFYFHVHFRLRCTCKKLWYLYSRPHLGQTWSCFPVGIEPSLLQLLDSRNDFSLSARRVIWLLKSGTILGWTVATEIGWSSSPDTSGCSWALGSTCTISWMATSKGLVADGLTTSIWWLFVCQQKFTVVDGSNCKITFSFLSSDKITWLSASCKAINNH